MIKENSRVLNLLKQLRVIDFNTNVGINDVSFVDMFDLANRIGVIINTAKVFYLNSSHPAAPFFEYNNEKYFFFNYYKDTKKTFYELLFNDGFFNFSKEDLTILTYSLIDQLISNTALNLFTDLEFKLFNKFITDKSNRRLEDILDAYTHEEEIVVSLYCIKTLYPKIFFNVLNADVNISKELLKNTSLVKMFSNEALKTPTLSSYFYIEALDQEKNKQASLLLKTTNKQKP